jgi:hypothetical protein
MNPVQITGTLSLALGNGPLVARIKISNPTFHASDGTLVPEQSNFVVLDSVGGYDFSLVPTAGSIDGNVFYTATYFIGLSQFTEHWFVPDDLPGPLSIADIRAAQKVPPFPFLVQTRQLFAPEAGFGDILCFTGSTWGNVRLQQVHRFEFTNVSSFVIPAATHGQGSHGLLVRCFDPDGWAMDPTVRAHPSTGDVSVYFNEPVSGRGFISGGPGRTLPNPSHTFIHQSTITIPVQEHKLYTTDIVIEVYDANGFTMDAASKQVTGDYTVIVTLASPVSGKVVLVGSLGSNPSPTVIPPIAPALGSTLTGSITTTGTTTIGNATSVAMDPITVDGANIGQIVAGISAVPALPPGVFAQGQVTGASTVTVELLNMSGSSVDLPSTTITVSILS